jgi:hypothetical protein
MSEDREIRSTSEIPEAPFYVVMKDSFMSDWGRAEGRDAVYVALAESRFEAEVVAANARARGDQQRIRINTTKPRPKAGWMLMLMRREDAERWYQPGGFAEQAAEVAAKEEK